ncbi:MAG: hypothetical protein QOE60_1361 [Thermoleophilaceae bacterium]|jgi:GNAT superfamily N-acetyltransferase|nr:hypothetical protein [Thermoleophilaceae bacterium]
MIFHDLHEDFDRDILERFHRDVLEPSFSADETVALEALAASIRLGNALVTVGLGEEGEVLGGIVGDWFDGQRVLLISYLAVRPDLRGQSIGTDLRGRAVETWPGQKPAHLVVAEVHDPRVWDGVGGDQSVARLRLFERFGARMLDVPFVQPRLQPGTDRVSGFLLLAFLVDEAILVGAEDGEGIRSRLIGHWIRSYYELAEGARPPYDPELEELLNRVERDDTVALLPLSAALAP